MPASSRSPTITLQIWRRTKDSNLQTLTGQLFSRQLPHPAGCSPIIFTFGGERGIRIH